MSLRSLSIAIVAHVLTRSPLESASSCRNSFSLTQKDNDETPHILFGMLRPFHWRRPPTRILKILFTMIRRTTVMGRRKQLINNSIINSQAMPDWLCFSMPARPFPTSWCAMKPRGLCRRRGRKCMRGVANWYKSASRPCQEQVWESLPQRTFPGEPLCAFIQLTRLSCGISPALLAPYPLWGVTMRNTFKHIPRKHRSICFTPTGLRFYERRFYKEQTYPRRLSCWM